MKKKILFIVAAFTFLVLSLNAQNVKANDVVGLWYAEKDSLGRIPVVEIYEENGKYYGYSFAYKEPYNGKESLDEKNPNPELRKLPLKGLVYIMGLSFNKNEWNDGKIYNPYDGKTYNGKMSIDKEGKLILRGSIDKAGILGKSMKWTRVPDAEKSRFKPLNRNELRKLN
ncbi:DUF2147 domain-containing protein [Brachyspira hampsonii]|uniref:Signal peptide protein n=2 Tax=Brachyspira hampsonii TaxID=1287055 RepID=A0A2U4F546_9SPIR|nr:DUF2147 domain-containing protein [Brachyspira hampsonii]EKV56080.1 signal peptide protein [Brachyspira hampsonii 30446]MBW5390719.1 DUF2147 domain-containing protein [Brachyspira hampsonii]OEJ18077.1 hypothetical protein A9495_06630 [Brachyspira hampsonii]